MYFRVLLDRRGPDAVEGPAGQGGLEEVRRVEGSALGGPGMNDRMELVDEEDHASLRPLHLLEDRLQALLEFAAELRPGQDRAEVEGDQPLLPEGLRDVLGRDAQGQALDDGGLPDTGLPDQDRVVLRPPGEDLHDAADLVVAADHRVEGVVPRELGEIPAVFLEGAVLLLVPARFDLLGRAPHGLHGRLDLRTAGAVLLEEVLGRRPDGEQSEQQEVGIRVAVLALLGLLLGGFDHGRERPGDVLVGGGDVLVRRRPSEVLLELLQHLGERNLDRPEDRGGGPVLIGGQGEEEMGGFDRRVSELHRMGEGALERRARGVRQPFEAHGNQRHR